MSTGRGSRKQGEHSATLQRAHLSLSRRRFRRSKLTLSWGLLAAVGSGLTSSHLICGLQSGSRGRVWLTSLSINYMRLKTCAICRKGCLMTSHTKLIRLKCLHFQFEEVVSIPEYVCNYKNPYLYNSFWTESHLVGIKIKTKKYLMLELISGQPNICTLL